MIDYNISKYNGVVERTTNKVHRLLCTSWLMFHETGTKG